MDFTLHRRAISPFGDDRAEARDEELLLAARAGSQAAFEELQRTYSHRIFKHILSITRNREDAEDAFQDTFLHAFRALSSFEGRSKFSSWLTRIAMNSALMILRKRRTRPEMLFEHQLRLDDETAPIEIRDNALNPEQLCDQKQRCEAVLLAVQRLDPKLRTAMSIWLSREHSVKEVASSLGVSTASVKARLHRARKRIAQSSALRSHKTRLTASSGSM
jgi:RNA polymerase sigma-70 factor (ECF subfamily)